MWQPSTDCLSPSAATVTLQRALRVAALADGRASADLTTPEGVAALQALCRARMEAALLEVAQSAEAVAHVPDAARGHRDPDARFTAALAWAIAETSRLTQHARYQAQVPLRCSAPVQATLAACLTSLALEQDGAVVAIVRECEAAMDVEG